MGQFSADQKAKAARREARMRVRVYPRRVQDGKMRAEEMEYETAIMSEIAADYEATCAGEDARGDLFGETTR